MHPSVLFLPVLSSFFFHLLPFSSSTFVLFSFLLLAMLQISFLLSSFFFLPSARSAPSLRDRLRFIYEGFLPASPRLPWGLFLLLTSVHHPSTQSSMISSSQHNRPRFVIADGLHSLARSTGSRRSGYLGSIREAKLVCVKLVPQH